MKRDCFEMTSTARVSFEAWFRRLRPGALQGHGNFVQARVPAPEASQAPYRGWEFCLKLGAGALQGVITDYDLSRAGSSLAGLRTERKRLSPV
jgi:hypothetical protein